MNYDISMDPLRGWGIAPFLIMFGMFAIIAYFMIAERPRRWRWRRRHP